MSVAAPTPVEQALERWLSALQGLGAVEPVAAAFEPQGFVLRYGWDEGRGLVRERFEGHAAIAAWVARTPREVEFALAGATSPAAQGWRVRYRIRLGDFENGGLWQLRLGAEGRIAELHHQPDDLPLQWQEGIPEGLQLPGFTATDFERARQSAIEAAEAHRRALAEGRGPHDHDHGHEHSACTDGSCTAPRTPGDDPA